MRPFLSTLLVVGLAVLARPCLAAEPPRYNVLLVSLDSVRRDMLGCYGYASPLAPGRSPSPVLDRLAADGVRMVDAFASSPWTLPSHVSLMTGEPTMVHLVEDDVARLPGTRPVLAEVLRRAGWRTAGTFSGPYLEPLWGFDRGFERYRPAYGRKLDHLSRKVGVLTAAVDAALAAADRARADRFNWKRREVYQRVRELAHADVTSERVTESVIADVDAFAAGGAPWFVFAHYFDPHYDYVPPAPFDTRFDPAYHGAIHGHGFFTNPLIAVPSPRDPEGRERRVGDRDLAHLRALHAGELAWVDGHLGRILARLDALGVADRTLVVVVSDHGDEFFEHGSLGHRQTVFDEVIRVPMLLRLPGMLPRGAAVRGPVSLADVVPTIVEILGLPAIDVAGRSLVPLVRGQESGRQRAVLSRLVRLRDGTLTVDGVHQIPGREALVEEAFVSGSIKIVRRRRWPFGPPGLPASVAQAIHELGERAYRQEELAWIDLERRPTEPPSEFSTRFETPEARDALERFQTMYREQSARTGVYFAAAQTPSAVLQQKLAGLGYVDLVKTAPDAPVRAFVLPAPGDTTTPLAR